MATPKMTKNQMRRAKKKEDKRAKANAAAEKNGVAESSTTDETEAQSIKTEPTKAPSPAPASQRRGDETVKEEPDATTTTAAAAAAAPVPDDLDYDDPTWAPFKDVFSKFGTGGPGDAVAGLEAGGVRGGGRGDSKGEVLYNDDEAVPDEEEEQQRQRLSKKKRKKLNTLSIAELKALVQNPEVVEWNDVSSSDPRLLVVIKAQKNVIPVPGHWSLKREYLSSKRGVEKPPFALPAFIAETGITEMRDAVLEKQAEQTLKQKQRERVQPKMGKIDIDYQKLYDAFFRFQTKPALTRFGDVYYEGKEWETEYRHFKPGELSDALKEALGMPPGFPPPWLMQQQRVGPPPSYPNLRIPGLNAPVPPGAAWGFAPGQWGKPPLDEYNRPLYGGDVFGLSGADAAAAGVVAASAGGGDAPAAPFAAPVERTLWGELQPPAEESEDEDDEDEDEDDEDEDADEDDEADARAARSRDVPGGLETPGGYGSTLPTDMPAPPLGVDVGAGEGGAGGEFDLRKQRRGFETEESAAGRAPRSAYTVIPERQAHAQGFFGSDRTYDLSKSGGGPPVLGHEDDGARKRKKPGDVDVALDVDALQSQDGISREELQRRFDEGRRDEGVGAQWRHYDDDLSEMIAQESRKRQKVVEDRKADKKKEAKYRF